MERTVGIWIAGVLLAAVLGGWVGAFVARALHAGSIHEPLGIIAGISAFTCVRLWLGQAEKGP